jgi:diguanylate cyclase (GGDEF)-like protein/PAS domain S-box-containing protein
MPRTLQEAVSIDTLPGGPGVPRGSSTKAKNSPAFAAGGVPLSLRAEEIRLLYRLSLVGYLATLLVAFVLGAALWDDLSRPLIFGWLGFISLAAIARYLIYKLYIVRQPPPEQCLTWSKAFVIGSGAMGIAWAFMGTVLLPDDGTFNQMMVLLLVSLLCTGAVAECAPSRPAFLAYVVPALFPLGAHLLWNGGREPMILGSVVILLGFIVLFIHDRANQAVRDALSARIEVMSLSDDLGRSERAVRVTQEALRREASERQRAEDSERKAAQRLRMHVEHTSMGVIEWDPRLRITSWNAAADGIFGYSRAEAVGADAVDLLVEDKERERIRRIWARSAANRGAVTHTCEHVRKDGAPVVCEWSHTPLFDANGAVFCVASLVRDITRRSAQEQLIHHMAHHDALTELPNRRLLLDRLDHAVVQAKRDGRSVALLYVDLDRFKLINDTFGHAGGDAVLREVARRLLVCVRAGDTVSREGGDEFLVALPNLERIEDARRVISTIRSELAKPHQYSGQEFQVTCSIGLSYFPGDADTPSALIKHADAAMYEAKESGRNALRGYTAGLHTLLSQRLDVENQLRRAMEKGEFSLLYQPQLEMASGTHRTLEGLMRWADRTTGVIRLPQEFIPIAEEMGLMGVLGEWAIKTAMDQVAAWTRSGLQGVRVAINLSPRQFLDRGLAATIVRLLAASGAMPEQIELEVTEAMLERSPEHAESVLKALADSGVGLAIDEFGSGYFALADLKRFPIRTIKIARALTAGLPDQKHEVAVTLAILSLARELGLRVVAEGVERPGQRQFLAEHGCEAIQGFLVASPAPAAEVERLVRGSVAA